VPLSQAKRIGLCAGLGALMGAGLKLSHYRDDWSMLDLSNGEEQIVFLLIMASCALGAVLVFWAAPWILCKILTHYFVD
jgi:hypothetical protein